MGMTSGIGTEKQVRSGEIPEEMNRQGDLLERLGLRLGNLETRLQSVMRSVPQPGVESNKDVAAGSELGKGLKEHNHKISVAVDTVDQILDALEI